MLKNIWMGSALVSVALALSVTASALAQADDDTATPDTTAIVDTTPDADAAPAVDASMEAPAMDTDASVAPALFLQVVEPNEEDVEVPLETAQLTVRGMTLPGAVVSVDGDLVDTDDQGGFTAIASLDEGANQIDVVVSDAQGNQQTTTLYVVRGE